MKKVLFIVALAIGLSSCTNNKTTLTIEKVTDGQVLQVESNVSMNVPGDSIVICETYTSGYAAARYTYYGNLAKDMPEDFVNLDSNSVYSRSYHVAVVKKVER